MERRRLLIGSGAALTTALAGCFGSETDDDSSDAEDGLEDSDTADDESSTDDNDNDDDTDDGDDGKYDDVPGFDPKELDLKSDKVSVDRVKRDGGTVMVEATTKTTDRDVLYAELESLADDLEKPTHDLDRFKRKIETVEWTIYDEDGKTVVSFYIRVTWIRKFVDDELTEDEFLDLVLDTVE